MSSGDDAPPALPEWEPTELAWRIANGHAHDEHFPEVEAGDLARLVQRTLDEGESRSRGHRAIYWQAEIGLVVIVNPRDSDGGTAFSTDEDFFRDWGRPYQ